MAYTTVLATWWKAPLLCSSFHSSTGGLVAEPEFRNSRGSSSLHFHCTPRLSRTAYVQALTTHNIVSERQKPDPRLQQPLAQLDWQTTAKLLSVDSNKVLSLQQHHVID